MRGRGGGGGAPKKARDFSGGGGGAGRQPTIFFNLRHFFGPRKQKNGSQGGGLFKFSIEIRGLAN